MDLLARGLHIFIWSSHLSSLVFTSVFTSDLLKVDSASTLIQKGALRRLSAYRLGPRPNNGTHGPSNDTYTAATTIVQLLAYPFNAQITYFFASNKHTSNRSLISTWIVPRGLETQSIARPHRAMEYHFGLLGLTVCGVER